MNERGRMVVNHAIDAGPRPMPILLLAGDLLDRGTEMASSG